RHVRLRVRDHHRELLRRRVARGGDHGVVEIHGPVLAAHVAALGVGEDAEVDAGAVAADVVLRWMTGGDHAGRVAVLVAEARGLSIAGPLVGEAVLALLHRGDADHALFGAVLQRRPDGAAGARALIAALEHADGTADRALDAGGRGRAGV